MRRRRSRFRLASTANPWRKWRRPDRRVASYVQYQHMLRLVLVVALLGGGTAVAAPSYKPPPDVAVALATFRAGAGQPAVDASRIVFARVPLVGMTAAQTR